MKGLKLSRGKQLNITQLPEKVISFTDFQIKYRVIIPIISALEK